MDFALSAEQEMLRAAARDYLADRYPVDRVVALVDADPGWDPASWGELERLGWLDPELGLLEHAVLAEEAGHALYPGPWWSTVALCGGLVPAGRPAALAWAEEGATSLADAPRFTAKADDGRLSGRKLHVPDGAVAEVLYVVAADGVHAVRSDADGVTVVPRSTTDRSRRLAEVVLDGAPAERVAGPEAVAGIRPRALALAACEAVGVAQRCLDIAASYAKERHQFGRPIGSYQGVSHRIADMYVAVQLARSLAYWAAWCVAESDEQAGVAVAAAKASAGDAAVLAAESAIQSMGGIGFTWDHPLQRYYKRAQWLAAFEGHAAAHRAQIAATLLG
ncbi:MAG: acyl-CoA dehydrogenase family protein [Frankiaceae bacterium]